MAGSGVEWRRRRDGEIRDHNPGLLEEPAGPNVLRRAGEYWTLAFRCPVFHLKDRRGLQHIALLLRHQNREIHSVDLAAMGATADHTASLPAIAEHEVRLGWLDMADPLLDRHARASYRSRWRELVNERAQAQAANDLGRLGRIQDEIEFLTGELNTSIRRGSSGRASTATERARVSVRNSITAALKAIESHNEAFARHLWNAIKTGTFCSYCPDRFVPWEL